MKNQRRIRSNCKRTGNDEIINECKLRSVDQERYEWYACAAFPGRNVKTPPHWKRDRFSEREFFGAKF